MTLSSYVLYLHVCLLFVILILLLWSCMQNIERMDNIYLLSSLSSLASNYKWLLCSKVFFKTSNFGSINSSQQRRAQWWKTIWNSSKSCTNLMYRSNNVESFVGNFHKDSLQSPAKHNSSIRWVIRWLKTNLYESLNNICSIFIFC